ncbi:YkoP family protein [Effusibacillus pohliae]|uniref:YkoP family protein n=1 Tax=Effusibacillus pohliae TaxID=232270 RepID=UPI0003626032|nr:hypothetical protein [Effusibacillus pohliae]
MNRWLLAGWRAVDVVYRNCRRFDFADYQGDNLFRVIVKPYNGPDVRVGEKWLRKGDRVGELHLYNYRLLNIVSVMTSEVQMGLVALREVRKSLPLLADFLKRSPQGRAIEALVGITILHRGAASLGFSVFDLEDSWYKRVKTFYMRLMLRICHPIGYRRYAEKGEHPSPKRVVMMRDTFFRKYGQKPAGVTN